ncbi:MAG: alpha/beta hydrolase family protein [Candidatus Latescibacterota bacterium]
MALFHCHFHSAALQIAAAMDVVLPQAVCLSGQRPPILYLLHGLSDDHTIWQRRTSIERFAEARGLAVVMPAVNRSFYTNMACGAAYWTFVSEEVPRLAQAFFPLSGRREETFVAGLSMGGYGAFSLGLRCPERFAAAASLSGALDIAARARGFEAQQSPEFRWIFGERAELEGTEHDLFHVATQVASGPGPRPRLYACCGASDFLYEDNVRFRQHALGLGLDLTWEEGPGDHEWGYWDQQIQRVLDWLELPAVSG